MTSELTEYRVACSLYSKDGKRCAEVREFSNGESYFLESEFDGATFVERHDGRLVGPFPSPAEAEHFIVATAWFNGTKRTSLSKSALFGLIFVLAVAAVIAFAKLSPFVAQDACLDGGGAWHSGKCVH